MAFIFHYYLYVVFNKQYRFLAKKSSVSERVKTTFVHLLRYIISSGSQVSLCACFDPSMTRDPSLFLRGNFSKGQSETACMNVNITPHWGALGRYETRRAMYQRSADNIKAMLIGDGNMPSELKV